MHQTCSSFNVSHDSSPFFVKLFMLFWLLTACMTTFLRVPDFLKKFVAFMRQSSLLFKVLWLCNSRAISTRLYAIGRLKQKTQKPTTDKQSKLLGGLEQQIMYHSTILAP